MKAWNVALSVFFLLSSEAYGTTIRLSPGQSLDLGKKTITCSSQPNWIRYCRCYVDYGTKLSLFKENIDSGDTEKLREIWRSTLSTEGMMEQCNRTLADTPSCQMALLLNNRH